MVEAAAQRLTNRLTDPKERPHGKANGRNPMYQLLVTSSQALIP
jgi:hypothetical protein